MTARPLVSLMMPARSTACRSAWRTSFLASAGWSAGSTVTPMYMLSSDCPTRILTFLLLFMAAVRSGVMLSATSTSPFSTWSFWVAGDGTSRASIFAILAGPFQ